MKFKMASLSESTYIFLTVICSLPDIENMGFDTKIKSIQVSEAKIWAKIVFDSGHFQ